MTSSSESTKEGFYGYPKAKEGPNTAYVDLPSSNPVLRGIPLAIAGSAAATFTTLSSFLWSNAGFGSLRNIKELDYYEPRYNPTVIPIAPESGIDASSTSNNVPAYRGTKVSAGRQLSVADYHAAFKAGKVTPTAVAKALLGLITTNPKHKVAFLAIVEDQVLEAAERSTIRYKEGKALGPLDGIPMGVKDEVDLHGHYKNLGSSKDFTHPDDITSWCVHKWEDAGAVIIGKLNMHELGVDTTNNNPTTGTPLNPYNPNYYTGGSSGGSAYTVSSGLLPITLGVDGGGSIRIPSNFCGIYGLKPTHSRVSRFPTISTGLSNSVAGPMAANMADLEVAYRSMATPNPSDPLSSLFHHPIRQKAPRAKIIGIYTPWFETADPVVLNLCHEALAHYTSLGYTIEEIHLPHLHAGQIAHAMTILTEMFTATPSLSGFSAATKILLAVGAQTPARDFLLAQKTREMLMQHLAHLWQMHPGMLIVTPTTPNAGWPIGGGDLKNGVSDANTSVRTMTFVWLANFTGCPAISIPVGLVKGGDGKVPVGLMAMGEWGDEEELMEWGREGEEWAWGEGRMERPENWVDVLGLAKGDYRSFGHER